MARADKLYDNPRSKKAREEQEADRGDVKEIDGEEYESVGYMKKRKSGENGEPDTYESDMPEEVRKGKTEPGEIDRPRPGGGTEFWRKRKKKEVPVS